MHSLFQSPSIKSMICGDILPRTTSAEPGLLRSMSPSSLPRKLWLSFRPDFWICGEHLISKGISQTYTTNRESWYFMDFQWLVMVFPIGSTIWSLDLDIIHWIYHLVMTNIAMENPNHKWRFRSLGKSSISMGHFPWLC